MSNKAPTWFAVARRPKWIGALLLSLMVAAIFGALGQWQLDRAFTKDAAVQYKSTGWTLAVELELMLDTQRTYLVQDRLQKGVRGYWVTVGAHNKEMVNHTLVLGWTEDLKSAEKIRTDLMNSMQAQAFLKYSGAPLPDEAPQKTDPAKPYLLKSMSVAQLINLYSPDQPIATQTKYYAVMKPEVDGLEPVWVDYGEASENINWLSAFYFLEWMLFAGFAVFLWWRLVKEAQLIEQNETVN